MNPGVNFKETTGRGRFFSGSFHFSFPANRTSISVLLLPSPEKPAKNEGVPSRTYRTYKKNRRKKETQKVGGPSNTHHTLCEKTDNKISGPRCPPPRTSRSSPSCPPGADGQPPNGRRVGGKKMQAWGLLGPLAGKVGMTSVVSFKGIPPPITGGFLYSGIPRFIPSFPTGHQQA